eukprot:gene14382-biopygen9151
MRCRKEHMRSLKETLRQLLCGDSQRPCSRRCPATLFQTLSSDPVPDARLLEESEERLPKPGGWARRITGEYYGIALLTHFPALI